MFEQVVTWWDNEPTSGVLFDAIFKGEVDCEGDVCVVVGAPAVGKDVAFVGLLVKGGCGANRADELREGLGCEVKEKKKEENESHVVLDLV